MTNAHEVTDLELYGWPAGARFFAADDGKYFVVTADLAEYPEQGNIKVVRQPTVILYTDSSAWPTDLTPDFTCDAGTDHAAAVAAFGYTL